MDWIFHHGAVALIFVGGGTAAISAFVSERKASGQGELRRRGIWPTLILIGAVIGGVGALWAGYQQDQLADYLSGGSSYGVFMPVQLSSKSMQFTFMEKGDTPLYDIMVDASDLTMYRKLWLEKGFPSEALDPASGWTNSGGKISADAIWELHQKTTASFPVANMGPGTARFAWEAPVPSVDDQRYQFSIWARNGLVTEQLLMHRGANGWVSAWRLERGDPITKRGWSGKLEEYVMPGFPSEKVKWN